MKSDGPVLLMNKSPQQLKVIQINLRILSEDNNTKEQSKNTFCKAKS